MNIYKKEHKKYEHVSKGLLKSLKGERVEFNAPPNTIWVISEAKNSLKIHA